jgi:hypothetical protein
VRSGVFCTACMNNLLSGFVSDTGDEKFAGSSLVM